MSGGLYDAATLERWNVVNRVLPDAELAEKSLRFAQRLAAGPTEAHHATSASCAPSRTAGSEARTTRPPTSAHVESFLADGPGKAKFGGI
jgi:enoyl-CoA hydratase/carnithine racemase